jgi:sugar/nucleoside kinase (ribokinase family)
MKLVCIGNAIVDGFAEVDEAFYNRFGLHQPVQHIDNQHISEIMAALPACTLCSGGGAANVAKIAAMLGTSTTFIGAVGSDSYGQYFEHDLAGAGVETNLVFGTVPTGMCLILRSLGGKNRIVSCPSAALQLDTIHIPESVFTPDTLAVIDGYMLGRDYLVQHIFEVVSMYSAVIALDVGSVDNVVMYAPDIIRYCQKYRLVLFMNEPESKTLYPDVSDSKREIFFTTLTGYGPFPIIVQKLGDRGATVFAGGTIYRAPTTAITPVDTTGAGDAFCAGFLSGWIKGMPVTDCADLGNKIAKKILMVPGTKIVTGYLND